MARRNRSDERSEPPEREELRRFHLCLAQSPVILAVSDTRARYVWIFNQARQFSAVETTGKTDLELGDNPGTRALYALKQRVLASREAATETIEFPLDGESRVYEITASPIYEQGELSGVATVGLDVTAQRAASESKSQFHEEYLRLLSHDIRQPLNVIGLAANQLAHEIASPSVAAFRDRVQSTVQSLNRTLEEIVDIGAWESGGVPLNREPTAIEPFLRELVASGIAPKSVDRIKLIVAAPGTVALDRAKIGRAVLNLLDNALKFAPKGSPVVLRATRQGDVLRVAVIDDGPGLEVDELENVFDKYRSSSDSRARGGKGLGLYSARLIVEAHGGSCRVESTAGFGATFWIELPCSEN